MNHPRDPREVLNWAGTAVAVLILLTVFVLGWFLMTSAIPKENENLIYAYVTGILGLASAVTGYFFGSSHQQKKQAETIDSAVQTAQTVAQTAATVAQAASPPTIQVAPHESVTVEGKE